MALWKKGNKSQAETETVPAEEKTGVFRPVAEADANAPATDVQETVTPDGEVHLIRTVREWHPHAPETLPEIEAAIDSWGGGYRSTETVRPAAVEPHEVAAKVDRITKRVKGSRKVVVQETVTEWVEGPMGSGPVAVEEEAQAELSEGEHAQDGRRPKRRFRVLGFIGSKPKAKGKGGKGEEDADYQPQCSALTDDGAQCRNSARHGSRYCSSHKGYQPPTAKGLAQRIEGDGWDPSDGLTDRASVAAADTKPRVRKAKDTRVKVRKAPKRKR